MNIFELLYISWKRERQSDKLSSLNEDFYEKVKPYLVHLESQYTNEKEDVVSSLFKRRWTRAHYILNDLVTLRLDKHFRESLLDLEIPSELPYEEVKFRENIDQIQNNFRNSILNIDFQPEMTEERIGKSYQPIIFSSQENSVAIGHDFNKYGPFLSDDITILPKENLRNYLIKSKGKEIELN